MPKGVGETLSGGNAAVVFGHFASSFLLMMVVGWRASRVDTLRQPISLGISWIKSMTLLYYILSRFVYDMFKSCRFICIQTFTKASD
jgi:hypothetical protein